MPNHLINESSPYLLQHANNPVEWYPWCDAAFKRARDEDKPVLLSIGYSSCHWCHVMAHESFENKEIAAIMNKNFINIKVDKEERPDIDSLYMNAVQMLAGTGGWPLTVFLTPEGKPFYGGTYFPPQDRHGLPGFPNVLNAITINYKENREQIETVSGKLVEIISGLGKDSMPQLVTRDILDRIYHYLQAAFDAKNGGFGSAPKFPQALILDFLLRYYHHTDNKEALDMVESTLHKMARGGIYDHLGGGFHRYSVDDKWLVPHFEKMLYDNALLSRIYLEAFLVTQKPEYKRIVEGTIDYMLREMISTQGGFYSSQDADSNGIEGAYYVWTKQEVEQALSGNVTDNILNYFGITEKGNFEGKNILHIANTAVSIKPGTIKEALKMLLEHREQRIRPGRDDKILASWNGFVISGMALAGIVFNRKDYLKAAVNCGHFIADDMMSDGVLQHVYEDGKAKINGQLQDYASVISGFLTLHETTLDIYWLRQAMNLADMMISRFWQEEERIFYDTDGLSDRLIIRPRHIYDDVLPSGNSLATMVLLKLSAITGNEKYHNIASYNLQLVADYMKQSPGGFTHWACAADFYLSGLKEVAIISGKNDKKPMKFIRISQSIYLPDKVVAGCSSEDTPDVSDIALLKDKSLIKGSTTFYLCENYTCEEPVTEVDGVKALFNLV
jgi:uncharacterized protein YyaL (SSP411 family)